MSGKIFKPVTFEFGVVSSVSAFALVERVRAIKTSVIFVSFNHRLFTSICVDDK